MLGKKNHWTLAFFLEASTTCQLLEITLKDLSLTNYCCYYNLFFQKWWKKLIISFQLTPHQGLKRRINLSFPTTWNWKFVNQKKYQISVDPYNSCIFQKMYSQTSFSRIHWPLIQYKTCLKTYKNALIQKRHH